MHTLLSQGVMNTEIFALLKAFQESSPGFTYATLQEFCQADWQWARHHWDKGRQIKELFNEIRQSASSESNVFRSGASETLMAYPLLRFFVERVMAATGKIAAERESFLALCKVLDLVQLVKWRHARAEI